MALKERRYLTNQSILKVYGYGNCKKIKVVTLACVRNSGVEFDDNGIPLRGTVNNEKLDESIQRARQKIFEYAFCNPWDYFFTGTLDASKYQRDDLDKYHKDFTRWLRYQGQKNMQKIDFLVVPELHSDGKSWHMHGFVRGVSTSDLRQFKLGDRMGKAIADKVKNGDTVFNWLPYADKFGFCDLEPIRNAEAVSKYVTKYIDKNLATSVKDLNAHLYYHSRGLKVAEVIKKGTMSANIVPSYQNDYCSVSWLDYSDEALQQLISAFNH